VLLFGAVGTLVLLAASLVHIRGGTEGGSSGGSTSEPSASARRRTLATTLVNRDDAAAILATAVGEPDLEGIGFVRGGSICRYHTTDRSATFTVIVRDAPHNAKRLAGLLDRGELVPYLGDRAASMRDRVSVLAAGWLLAPSIRLRNAGTTDRPPLVEGAQQAAVLLSGHEAGT
jgi:hypothetical protein